MKRAILFVAFAALCGAQTTVNGGRDYKGTLKASGSVSAVDFTGAGSTAPAKAGDLASRPSACTQGQIYFATDAAAGQNLYFCTATGAPGVWTQMSGATTGPTTAGTGAPSGNCTPPAMYVDTTNQDLWFCGAANSWKRPTADTSGLATLAGTNTWTGYSNLSGGQWRPPESTVANLPSAAGNAGKVFMVTDAVTAGSCSTGGGTLRELCRAAGSTYECVGGCGSGPGSGITTMTTGATDPVASCTAPSTSNLAVYTQTTTQDLWACVAPNTWKKVLSTSNTGTYTSTGAVGTAPPNPASGELTCYYSSVSLTQICLDASGNAFTMVKAATSRTANQFVTHVPATGIPVTAAIVAGDIPTLNQDSTGNSATATALAANGANCPAGSFPLGVDAAGAVESCTAAATIASTNTFIGRQDATGAASTAPVKSGTSVPGSCTVGDVYFKTDATAGQNLYFCTATNTYTQQSKIQGLPSRSAHQFITYVDFTGAQVREPLATDDFPSSASLTTPVINGLPTGSGVSSAATASTLAARNASGELIATNTVATGKTPMATDTTLAVSQIAPALITPPKMSASTFDTQTDASTVTWAIGSVLNAQATLTFTVHSGSRTLNITNPAIGGNYVLKLIQDSTGGEGLTLGTGCTWKVANGGAGAVTLTNAANAVDVLTFIYDGTNCLASFLANLN